jgi:hypothetical protein
VIFALVFATAGIGAVATITISSPAPSATLGTTTPVTVAFDGVQRHTVHLFAGTADGTSIVSIDGRDVVIPVGGRVFAAGSGSLAKGSAAIPAAIPDDHDLVGSRITWVAVLVDNATGRVVAIASAGGPIIEDAIC